VAPPRFASIVAERRMSAIVRLALAKNHGSDITEIVAERVLRIGRA
jgi:hypothetical protein